MISLFKVAMNTPEVMKEVEQVLSSGFIGQGPVVEEFEKEFTNMNRPMGHFISMNSCTSSIMAVLTLLKVGPGDEVITTPMTCIATNAPILALGARPVWADVNPHTGLIDPVDVKRKITPRTKAVIAVNWTGRPADYASLRTLGVYIIEDAAHGPVIFHDRRAHFTCFSFGPIKHFTTGDGGGVFTDDKYFADQLRLIRWYGLDRTSTKDFRCEQDIKLPGLKYHMTDINAAIGLGNLSSLMSNIYKHQQNAKILWDNLYKYMPYSTFSFESNYWVFPFLTNTPQERNHLKDYLALNGIMSSPVHARNDKHTGYNFYNGYLPGVEYFDTHQLNLPCGWWVTQEEIMKIINVIHEFYAKE